MVNVSEEAVVSNDLQLVTFCLKKEEFAIDIQQVREVLKLTQITPLPHSSEFIEGVINLRGEVIPVIDLRRRFGQDSGERNSKNRIIIVEVRDSMVGLVVDSVTEVLHLERDTIEAPPSSVSQAKTDFIQGVGKLEDRLIIVLKVDNIIASDDKIDLEELTMT